MRLPRRRVLDRVRRSWAGGCCRRSDPAGAGWRRSRSKSASHTGERSASTAATFGIRTCTAPPGSARRGQRRSRCCSRRRPWACSAGGATVRDLGEHQLRGVDEPVRLQPARRGRLPGAPRRRRRRRARRSHGDRPRRRLGPACARASARPARGCGFEIVGQAGNADEADAEGSVRTRPTSRSSTIRMPPTPHRRRACRGAGDPREASRDGRARPVAVRRVRLRARAPAGECRGRGLPPQWTGCRNVKEFAAAVKGVWPTAAPLLDFGGRLAARGPPSRRGPDLAVDRHASGKVLELMAERAVEPGDWRTGWSSRLRAVREAP